MSRLAIYTFGILKEAPGHEQVQGFLDRTQGVFEAAAKTEHFIARIDAKIGATDPLPDFFQPDIHAAAAETLSLWKNLESAYAFTYYGVHGEAFKNRREWVIEAEWPSYALWWSKDDYEPTFAEAYERHQHLHDNGATAHAFDFKNPFDDQNNPTTIDRKAVQNQRQ